MEDYLNYTLNVLKSRNYVNLTIVLGNESCDLDSAVSSLVYATFLHWQHQKMKCKVCTRNKRDESTYKDDIFVSLLDVDRQDLPLKTEVAFCFKEYGLRDNFLLFRDDIDLKKLVEDSKINIVLVDHHVLSKKYEFLSPYVTEIIDHRPIDKNNWSYKDDVRSTIEIVGSCCTLVTQRIQDLSALMNRGDFFEDYKVCADLLHSVILLDTVNFSKEVNKATPHDIDKVQFLETILKPSDCIEERKSKVQRLVEARSDVALLNAAQLLRKDFKIVGDVFIPSFPILVEVYLRKPEALKAVSEALSQRKCTVALLLGMDLTGALRRDGAIISDDAEKVELLSKILQEWTSPCLQLSPEEKSECFFFKQLNLSASRKQYIEPVNEFLNNCN
ncbi:exopolyphosphatase PRUNE1 [Pieris rapae]|uniref:exopolyphosphatase PRUNE1 n=1 Tax=Pieris rapae TaxID=64459 RepID=UPI001E281363|nr:exopolyphosphatase PRUNE1 [Pieris rapae]XP_045489186.1 exopolyphosphatase PRUNE1 [Pieris rapae]